MTERSHPARWTYAADGDFTSPAVGGGVVFVSNGKIFHAFDAATGEAKWTCHTNTVYGQGRPTNNPSVADGVAFFGSSDGDSVSRGDHKLHALALAD